MATGALDFAGAASTGVQVGAATGNPIAGAAAASVQLLLSRLTGGSASGAKAERRNQDIQNQANEVASIGQTYLQQAASIDPSAPELSSYVAFVEQKIAESPGPGDEQGMVRAEGQRLLSLVQQRTAKTQADTKAFNELQERQAREARAAELAANVSLTEKRIAADLELGKAATEANLRQIGLSERNAVLQAAQTRTADLQAAREAQKGAIPPEGLILGAVALAAVFLFKRK